MDWLVANWDICLLVFMIAEKGVKLSATKADDIVLDIIWNGIKSVVKGDDKKSN